MKACMLALGGDQFQLPQQKKQMSYYFSWHFAALKLAYLFASLLTPVLRYDVKCFGMEYCFPLAFGVPGVFLIVAFGNLKLLLLLQILCKFLNIFSCIYIWKSMDCFKITYQKHSR